MDPRSFLPDIAYGTTLLVLLRLTRPAYLAFRKKRSGYGIVFNSVTEIPEALATVTLFDLHGRVMRTTVTDKHGRYRLLAPKGEFIIEVDKAGFNYPSIYLGDKAHPHHFVYDNVLTAKHIIANDYGIITKNIPIDPSEGVRRKSWLPHFHLNKSLGYTIGGLSPFAAFAFAWWRADIAAWVCFGIFFLILLKRLFSFKPADPPFGTIRDAATSQPIGQTVIRIFDAKTNKVLETQVTSPKGHYAFLVRTGAYYVLAQHEGYKTVRLNFPHIKKDGFLLVKDIRMKKKVTSEVDY